jgi:hypothetical protein
MRIREAKKHTDPEPEHWFLAVIRGSFSQGFHLVVSVQDKRLKEKIQPFLDWLEDSDSSEEEDEE